MKMVAASNEFGRNPIEDLEILQLFLGRFFIKVKENIMEKKYEFYPMMTKTLKNIIFMSQFKDYGEIMGILLSYPDYGKINEKSPIFAKAILDELDRQYDRWQNFNKKGE